MLLRSSSTPVLGSLISSFSESPSNNHYQSEVSNATPKDPFNQKLSCGHRHFPKSLWHSSPSSTSTQLSPGGFRRVRSDGNLEELANIAYNVDEFSFSKKFARRPNGFMLESIPSFSSRNLGTCQEDEYSDDDEDEEEYEEFGVENQFKHNMEMKEEMGGVERYDTLSFGGGQKMYIARGLGIGDTHYEDEDGPVEGGDGGGGGGSRRGGGGGRNYRPVGFDRDGGDSRGGVGIEEHYKRMLEQSPGNPLVLRNYAHFLYQTKGELQRAEEYYSRAILADPGDGEILSEYAKLVWELHHDKGRAKNYFERALQASSDDCHVQAAYASFLWEIDDEDEDEDEDSHIGAVPFHGRAMASASA